MAQRARNDHTRGPDAVRRLCSVCRAPLGPEEKLLPFCSDRCKWLDLGRWLGERYRIKLPAETTDGGRSEDEPSDLNPDAEGSS